MSDGSRAHLPLGLEETEVSGETALGHATLPGVGAPAAGSRPPDAAPQHGAARLPRRGDLPGSEDTLRDRADAAPVPGQDAALRNSAARRSLQESLAGTDLRPGEHVGRYVIERKVGAGGMGEVYAAHDPQLDRRVAIKVLRPTARAADAAARLVREAQALAKLAHPNVVAVYDVGEADDRVFLAMQFVEGATLGEHLARNRLAWDEIVRMYVAAGRGLAAAHAAGLIHRDMKPSNVLVDRDGHVAVTDFGVARASDEASTITPEPFLPPGPRTAGPRGSDAHITGRSAPSTDMTQAGAVIGTPPYMAPEQHAGQRATAKSDQFGFCVSVWQGLFGKHPFVPDDHDEETSPFEYMALISEAVLVPPRKGHGVPRRIVAALTRGLLRAPEARWPSMNALLDALEPRSGTRTVVIALAAIATLGAGAALWLAFAGGPGASCASQTAERVQTAWNPKRQAALHEHFVATGRPYAAASARAASSALDRYAEGWRGLAIDACAGAGGPDAGDRAFVAARAQCLDRRLSALRSVGAMLAAADRGELVDNALQVVSGLPDLDDCADPASLRAAGAIPEDRKAQVAALEERFTAAKAKHDAGLFREAFTELEALVPEVDAAGWVPLRVQVRVALGDNRVSSLEPATELLLEAARLATEHGLDRDASRAWTGVMQSAGMARVADAVEAYAQIARAAAAATHDPALINRVRIYHGRALIRLRRHHDAEPHCRAALADVETRPGADWREVFAARDCLLEIAAPLGRWAEAVALAEESIAARGPLVGAEHPAIADYLSVIARVKRTQGKHAEAKADLERVRDIRLRAFGPKHLRHAETLEDLASVEPDLGKRKAMLEEALAIATAPEAAGPRAPLIEYALERSLADVAGRAGDHAAMQRHFERAVALAEASTGPRSLDVGMLLIGYGQYMSEVDLDQSLAKLRQAVEILDALRDKRAEVARGALAMMLMKGERYREALPVLEQALAAADVENMEPFNLATMRASLANALVHTGGDRARARALATQGLEGYRAIGPEGEDHVGRVEAWLKKYR